MSLERVLVSLSGNLSAWMSTGLNEAQTSQVIVLPVLQALGYDIWNPYEVLAQGHSGGGSGAYAPDFSIKLESTVCFIIEVKAFSREFSGNDEIQAVNYVNALGRRWAILTNGKAWHFYDNQISRPVSEKLALTVELKNVKAQEYLSRLLAREVWTDAEAEMNIAHEVSVVATDIRKRLQLGEIEDKLRGELAAGFTVDEKGLGRAIELTLKPNERELAQEEFAELAKRLLGAGVLLESPAKNMQPTLPAQTVMDLKQTEIVKAMIRGIEVPKTYRRQRQTAEGELEAYLDGKPLDVNGWRDLNAGIAEAMLALGRRDYLAARGLLNKSRDERRKAHGSPYPPSGYRELSNSEFLFLHASAATHQQRIRQMIGKLGMPRRTLQVSYQGQIYPLP